MKAKLKAEIAKLTLTEKMRLADRLEAQIRDEIAALGCPPGIMSEDAPGLEAELKRRLKDANAHPEMWLTLEQFRAQIARLTGRKTRR